jgi:uncharacterized protein (TIGR00730 family)
MPRRPATPDEELIGAQEEAVASEISDATRVERMATELAMGFRELDGLHRAVSVFGSARTPPGTPEYELAREVGRRLGAAGFAVITGGGPGAMEAANRGAREAGALSIGLNIDLPFEHDHASAGVDLSLDFHYFFCRKVMFVRYANAFIALPGGYGTLDELFEILTLVQTHKMRKRMPIVLFGAKYWNDILNFDALVKYGTISPGDVDLFQRTDSVDEAYEIITRGLTENALGSPGAVL